MPLTTRLARYTGRQSAVLGGALRLPLLLEPPAEQAPSQYTWRYAPQLHVHQLSTHTTTHTHTDTHTHTHTRTHTHTDTDTHTDTHNDVGVARPLHLPSPPSLRLFIPPSRHPSNPDLTSHCVRRCGEDWVAG